MFLHYEESDTGVVLPMSSIVYAGKSSGTKVYGVSREPYYWLIVLVHLRRVIDQVKLELDYEMTCEVRVIRWMSKRPE